MNINLSLLFTQIINVLIILTPLIILLLIGISVNRRFRNIENHLADIERAIKEKTLTQQDTKLAPME